MDTPSAKGTVKVSVIIIFLNPAALLGEAIVSVLSQSFKNWELLLVDDGSSDQSCVLARNAAAAHEDRIVYLEHPGHANLGTSGSRNLGLHAAQGDYLLFLDADDVLFVGALEMLVGLATADERLGAVFATTLWWNWAPEFAGRKDGVQTYGRRVGRHKAPRLLRAMIFDETLHPANCSSLIRRDALLAVGGFEAEFSGMYEDTVVLAKLLLRFPVFVTDVCVSAYRMHPASQCHRAAAEGSYDRARPNDARGRYLRWLRVHLTAADRSHRRLQLILARELWSYERPTLFRIVNSYKIRAIMRVIAQLFSPMTRGGGAELDGRLSIAQAELRTALANHSSMPSGGAF